MASEFYVGVKIGATMLASFGSALAGSKNTLLGLGRVSEDLKAKQVRLGDAVSKAMTHPTRNIGLLINQYNALGRSIDQVKQKHLRLSANLAKGESLRLGRNEMKSEMVGTVATAAAVATPVIGAVKKAALFEADLRDIAITGNLNKREEIALGAQIRNAALATSQGHDAIMQGVNTLVAAGMDAKKAGAFAPLIGKVATATNADMKELAGMVFSLSETLGIKGDAELKAAFNRAAYGAKLGRFELKDMAKALPEMTAAFAAKGIRGQQALTQIVASLEIGREGAGSGDEAVTNLRNWLAHMNTKHTTDAYTKVGVDYQKSMQNLVAGGYSSYEASLEIAQKFIASRGDGFMKKWKEAGSKGDQDAQRKLMESFGLNEVFQDIQTINHLLAMRQNWDKYQNNKKQMGSKEAMSTIDVDYQKRAELAAKAWENFKTRVADVGITIGNALLPPLTELMTAITPIIGRIGDFAAAHPGAIRAIVGFVGAVVGMKVATLALGWGINFFVKSPMVMLMTSFSSVAAKYTLLRALLIGGAPRLSTVFQLFGVGASSAGKLAVSLSKVGGYLASPTRALMPFARGLLLTFTGPLTLMGKGVLYLGKLLGGVLLSGLKMAGQAVLWLGRALMLNPIGLIVTAIGVGAYLIYRHWGKIKPWFAQLWTNVSAVFSTGWAWIKQSVLSFSPLDLLRSCWGKVKPWFTQLWSNVSAVFSASWVWIKKSFFSFSPLSLLLSNWGKVKPWFTQLWSNVSAVFSVSWMWIKKSFFSFSPLGLLLSNWGKVKPWFAQLWSNVNTVFSAGWARIKNSFLTFSPLGLVRTIWQPLFTWFKALPSQFLEFGSNLISGLVRGIASKLNSAKEAIIGFGANIKNWFKETLGIHSPSRVFMGFGDNIAQGAAIGIGRSAKLASKAAKEMAEDVSAKSFYPNNTQPFVAANGMGRDPNRSNMAQGGGVTIHFSPTITLQANTDASVKEQVQEALKINLRDLEQLIRRVANERQRRAY